MGTAELSARLKMIVGSAWEAASVEDVDLRTYQAEAAAMVPSGEAPWITGAVERIVASDIVQRGLAAIDRALEMVESAPSTWRELRAEADGRAWAKTLL